MKRTQFLLAGVKAAERRRKGEGEERLKIAESAKAKPPTASALNLISTKKVETL